MKKKTIGCIFIVIILAFAACGKNTQTWQELYDLGEKYLLEENYEEAIVAFTSAIELDPKQAVVYVGRGDAYAAHQDVENHLELALADYSQALELDNSIPEAYLGMADVYIQQENYDEALDILQKGYEITNSEEILEQISAAEEIRNEYENENMANETAESTYEGPGELYFENEALTVAKTGENAGIITLRFSQELLPITQHTLIDVDIIGPTVEFTEDMMEYGGTSMYYSLDMTWPAENFETDRNLETYDCNFYHWVYFEDSDDSYAFDPYGTVEIVEYTENSITWSFQVFDEYPFDFDEIDAYRVHLQGGNYPDEGNGSYSYNREYPVVNEM